MLSARDDGSLDTSYVHIVAQQIGEALHLSPHTVKEHASRVFRKLDARNRAEAVQRAQRLGLLA